MCGWLPMCVGGREKARWATMWKDIPSDSPTPTTTITNHHHHFPAQPPTPPASNDALKSSSRSTAAAVAGAAIAVATAGALLLLGFAAAWLSVCASCSGHYVGVAGIACDAFSVVGDAGVTVRSMQGPGVGGKKGKGGEEQQGA